MQLLRSCLKLFMLSTPQRRALASACVRPRRRSRGGNSTGGHSSSTGVVVDDRMVRWVPYKHANGMAIYYRQTPAEEGITQVGAAECVDCLADHRGRAGLRVGAPCPGLHVCWGQCAGASVLSPPAKEGLSCVHHATREALKGLLLRTSAAKPSS